jgi:hypothetical protein
VIRFEIMRGEVDPVELAALAVVLTRRLGVEPVPAGPTPPPWWRARNGYRPPASWAATAGTVANEAGSAWL